MQTGEDVTDVQQSAEEDDEILILSDSFAVLLTKHECQLCDKPNRYTCSEDYAARRQHVEETHIGLLGNLGWAYLIL